MKIKLELTEEEFMDVQSALSFFEREYETVSGDKAPKTLASVRKIIKKFWTILRKARP